MRMMREVEKIRKRVLGVENFIDLLSLFHAFAIGILWFSSYGFEFDRLIDWILRGRGWELR